MHDQQAMNAIKQRGLEGVYEKLVGTCKYKSEEADLSLSLKITTAEEPNNSPQPPEKGQ